MKLLLPWLLLLVLGKCESQCINDQYGNLTWPATQSGHSVSLQCDSSGDQDSSVRRNCEGRDWVTEHDPCEEELRGAHSKLNHSLQSEPRKLMRRLDSTPTSCYLNSEQLTALHSVLLQVVDSLETPSHLEVYSHHFNSILCSGYKQFRESFQTGNELLGLWNRTVLALYKIDPPIDQRHLILFNNNFTVYLIKIGNQSATSFNLKHMNVTIGTGNPKKSETIRMVFMTNKRLFGGENSKEPVISVTFHSDQGGSGADVRLYVDPEEYPGSQKCLIWSEEENDWKTHSITMRPKPDKLLCHYKETGVYSYAKLGVCKDDKLSGLTWKNTIETQYQSQYCLSSSLDPFIRRRCGRAGVWEPLKTNTTCLDTDSAGIGEYLDIIYLQLEGNKVISSQILDSLSFLEDASAGNLTLSDMRKLVELLHYISDKISVEKDITTWLSCLDKLVMSPIYESMSSDRTQNFHNGNESSILLTALETVVTRLVLSKQQFQFYSQAFEVAVFRAVKFKFRPDKIHLNGTDIKFFDAFDFIGSPIRTIEIIKYTREKLQIRGMTNGNNVLHDRVPGQDLYPEIVSVKIKEQKVEDIEGAVQLVFTINKHRKKHSGVMCVYWNEKNGSWSRAGLTTTIDHNKVICNSSHLTSFSILLSTAGADDIALENITIGSLIASALFLLISLFALLSNRKIRQLISQRIHIWLCGNLLLLNLTFLGGHDKTEDRTICTVIAVLILFFALSSMFWMTVEGYALYEATVSVYNSKITGNFLRLTAVLNPLLAATIITATLLLDENFYDTTVICWLTKRGTLIFYIPVVIGTVLFNLLVLVQVLHSINTRPSNNYSVTPTSQNSDQKRDNKMHPLSALLKRAKAVCSLSVLFGLSWGFGILGFFTDSVILSYLFALTTTLQGFFFFIFFILMKNDLRQILWKRISTFRGGRVKTQTRNRTVLRH
ncbi:adhesion G protein-coupled receptor L4-like isoform X2 [Bolinopsis microptera]|uniref:adhesion G protein-coupled receptor L4-like isoform X2 n=1 Tax=Bolinopsis microptera TaxID=2820187 RepID=UPI0030795634